MLKVSGGYTIIEVIIVLVVASSLVAGALVAVGGNDSRTRFAQSMRDINSKMEDWINDVSTGFTRGNVTQFSCNVNSGRPQINSGIVGPRNPDCIFLGKAVQFTDQADPDQSARIYAYSVFGRRVTNSPNGGTQLVSNLVEANPAAATGNGSAGTADLTDVYTINGGAKVRSVSSVSGAGTASSAHLIGFYSSFNTEQSTAHNGAQFLQAYTYRLNSNVAPGNQAGGSTLTGCIALASGSTCQQPPSIADNQWPESLRRLEVCFVNDRGNQTAVLTISSNDGVGVNSRVEFKDCT